MSTRRSVERSQLLALDALAKALEPNEYAVAGGANLRFFFGSVRYCDRLELVVSDGVQEASELLDGVPGAAEVEVHLSRSPIGETARVEAVDAGVLESHGLAPVTARHYDITAAFSQTVRRLAEASSTPARDVFDLDVLIGRGALPSSGTDTDSLIAAADRACDVGFSAFKAQVLGLLAPEHHGRWASSSAWDAVVLRVADVLQGGTA